ncbi:hypothetical protein [Methylobacterium gnaphalii]|uniref:Uncharacterized protein n=1 Tax=Methylobacterium gnaphalii TaxID=1010610 RepID=A0A512JP12_9HYPH|nr:hypothetical protein [Methylobacterium gnaphalii]GEP11678.1 hypothetical protein MGN01_35230 [Methylobacterium gnaphalii]GJD71345.1 hypothetical protein MMMDOFMJ_4301 [Methylobacterium gnaphalii]
MGEVQTRNQTGLASSPEPATRAFLDLVSKHSNRLEENPDNFRHKLVSAALAPHGAERAALIERRLYLTESFKPDEDRGRVRAIVIALMGAFPTYGTDKEAASAIVSLTCRALDDIPTWAVQEAATRFLKGTNRVSWDPRNAPTAPLIRGECRHAMLPIEEELFRIGQILDAEVVDIETTEAERAQALARWAEVRSGIKGANVITERTDEEISAERAAMRRANERFEGREYRPMAAASTAKAQSLDTEDAA